MKRRIELELTRVVFSDFTIKAKIIGKCLRTQTLRMSVKCPNADNVIVIYDMSIGLSVCGAKYFEVIR